MSTLIKNPNLKKMLLSNKPNTDKADALFKEFSDTQHLKDEEIYNIIQMIVRSTMKLDGMVSTTVKNKKTIESQELAFYVFQSFFDEIAVIYNYGYRNGFNDCSDLISDDNKS